MKTAVLVVGFNRPDLLRKVLAEVSDYSPKALYIACDGPRQEHPSDIDLVHQSQRVANEFNWYCRVFTKFEKHNLGLRASMISALDWFFEYEPEGIVLEDDCVPTPDFFSLMTHILDKYRNEYKVWGGTGSNPSRAPVAGGASYGFIRSALVWGWASWADRWASYDRDLVDYLRSGLAGEKSLWQDPFEYHALDWHLRQILQDELRTSWAYPWSWTVMHHDGLWAVPAQNLVANVGFRADATHTQRGTLDQSVDPLGEITSPVTLQRDIELQKVIHRRQHRVVLPLWLNYVRNAYRHFRAQNI